MLRIYLDQNKWVDLSKGARGSDPRFSAVATVLQAGVRTGQVSLPLSTAHVYETWKRRRSGPRQALARTMSSISRNHAIAPPWALVPAEIDRALAARFGTPTRPLPLREFGVGMVHRSGTDVLEWGEDFRELILAAFPGLDPRTLDDQLDAWLLAGPPADLPVAGIDQPPLRFAEDFAAGENELMERFVEHGSDKDERRRTVSARMLLDLREPLAAGCARAGITAGRFLDLGQAEITRFMLDLPSRAGALELAWLQADNLQTKWTPNDLTDVMYLSLAVAYCDVVVTERKWTALLRRTGVPERFETTVLSDLAELTDVVISAGRPR